MVSKNYKINNLLICFPAKKKKKPKLLYGVIVLVLIVLVFTTTSNRVQTFTVINLYKLGFAIKMKKGLFDFAV